MKYKFNKDFLHKGIVFKKDESLTDEQISKRLEQIKKKEPNVDLEAEKKRLLDCNKVVK